MTTAVQRRRGTTTEHASFTGLEGEISVNTTKETLVVHDGSTAGGFELARADGSNFVATSVDINGGTIDGTTIGASSASTGAFTTLTASGEITANGGIALGDNDKATFGAGDDLQIYHNGNNSVIADTGTGVLEIRTNGTEAQITGNSGTDYSARFQSNGAVKLYHDNSQKLATTATGIDITGTATMDGLTVDGLSQLGTVSIYDSGTNATVAADSGHDLEVRGRAGQSVNIFSNGTKTATFDAIGDVSFFEDTGTTAALFWDASAESLCLGNTAAGAKLDIRQDSGFAIRLEDNNGYYFRIAAGGATEIGGNLDVTGSVVADGLTAHLGSNASDIVTLSGAAAGRPLTIQSYDTSLSGSGYDINASGSAGELALQTYSIDRLKIGSGGDVSLYENTGTTAKFFWDASAESLGIGTSSPSQMLELSADNGSGVANVLRFNDADTGVSSGQTTGRIEFAENDGGSTTVSAFLEVDTVGTSGGGVMTFGTGSAGVAAAERMRIDSSGNLLVGTTSVQGAGGVTLSEAGYVYSSRPSSTAIYADRTGSDGAIQDFRKDGTTVGSIGSNGNRPYFASTNCGIRLGGADLLPATSTGVISDATVSLGSGAGRWANLYLSGGVYLGGTGAANKLDDYEEGTALTTITCGTSGTVTLNAGFDTLGYTKVGRLVTCHGLLVVSSVSAPVGNFYITLPFTLEGGAERSEDSVGNVTVDITNTASINAFVCAVYTGSSTLTVQLGDANTVQNDSAAELKAGSNIYFSVTYPAA